MILKDLIKKLVIFGLEKPEWLDKEIYVEGNVLSSDLVLIYVPKVENDDKEILILCEKS